MLEGKAPGGQLLNTELIEDYPGFLSILGVELATVMEQQAAHFGTELVRTEVRAIKVQPDGMKLIETYDGDYLASAVIITAGGNPRKLGRSRARRSSRAAASRTARSATGHSSRTCISRWPAAATPRWRRRCSSRATRAR